MGRIRRLLSFIFAFLLSGSIATSCRALSSDPDTLIRDIINTYYTNPRDGQHWIQTLFARLKEVDEEKYEVWSQIMDYWDYVREDMEIHLDALPDDLPIDDSLCLIVCGFRLNSDGSMHKELIARLETALNCAKQYPEAYVLCTGGGTAENNSSVTEASAMGNWLLENGLPEEKLILEDRSMSTPENAKNSRNILREKYPQVTQTAIVTSDYHVPWAIVLFQTEFIFESDPVSVVTNAAPHIEEHFYYNIFHLQKEGIMEITGLR